MSFGKEQGALMAAKGAKAYGYGAHADKPCRFTTIEQKVSGVRMWYDEKLKKLSLANPFRNQQLLDVMSSLENTMGRTVAHKPSMIKAPHLRAMQGEVDLDNANEVSMVSFSSKNVVKGSRAQTEFMLDWDDVEFVEASGERSSGAIYHNQSDKTNKSQRTDKAKKALQCTTTCKGKVERKANGKLVLETFCPVHLDMHLRSLQARDVKVAPEKLRGPPHAEYRLVKDAPAGATVRRLAENSEADQVGPLVCVVTREQSDAGMGYDRSQPFMVNGTPKWPPVRGLWVEVRVDGQNYIVHAWANASGVTHRMRKQARTTNQRSDEEVIPQEMIKKWSSKSHRITMITLLTRKGVPIEEVSAMADHESVEMTQRYIESLDALACERRNMTNVIYSEYSSEAAARTSAPAAEEGISTSTAEAVPLEAGDSVAVDESVATDACESQQSIEERLGLNVSMEQLIPEVFQGPQVDVAQSLADNGVSESMYARGAKRAAEGDAQYEGCCDKPFKQRKGNPLAGKKFQKNTVLQGLLQIHCDAKPQVLKSVLCGHNYHVTCREITNFRSREKERAAASA
jgi:hypothetical protein